MSYFCVPARFKKMLMAVFLGRGLMAIRQLILVPVLISVWGVDYYGSWLILTAVPTFLSMSNLGLGTSANIQIALEVSANKSERAGRTFATSQWLITFIAIIVMLISYIAIHLTRSIVNSPTLIDAQAEIVILLLGAFFLNMLAVPLIGWWTGIGKPATGYNFLNIFSLVSLVLSILVPLLGGRALATATSLFLWSFVWLVVFQVLTFRKFDWTAAHYSLKSIDTSVGKMLLTKGVGHQFGQLWQAILFQGSLMLAGFIIGPSGAALWGAMRILTRSGNQIIEIISQSMSPEFQITFAKGDYKKIREIHIIGISVSFVLAAIVVVGLIVIGPTVFSSWTRHAFDLPMPAWYLLSISLLPFSFWSLSAELQRAINEPWMLNIWAVISSLIAIAFMGLFSSLGILSFSIGTFIFEVAMAIFVIPRTMHLLGTSVSSISTDFHEMLRTVLKKSKRF